MASRLPDVARVLAGLVVVAVVVGIGLWVERATGDELELPERVAGLDADDSDAVLDEFDSDRRDNAVEEIEAFYDYNDEHLSDAYDGAESAVRRYGLLANADMHLLVTAVRAESGPLVPLSFEDPERLGLAAPRTELVEEGDVTCLLTRSNPPLDDAEADEEDLAPASVLCQRTGGDLTVRVLATREPEVDAVVDATDEVWEDLT